VRRISGLVGTFVALAMAAGCASAATARSANSAPTSSNGVGSFTPSAADPTLLVGSWQLGAPGQQAGSVLRLGDDLSLWSGCGYLSGTWAADRAGLLVGQLSGGDAACMDTVSGQDPTPGWLRRVVAFKTVAANMQLLDARGGVVATLRPGGRPTAGPNLLPAFAQPPVVTDELRARLRTPVPLPTGLVAALPSQLVGRWVSAAIPTPNGFVVLAGDGSWTGSDGANGQGGRWSATTDGQLVVAAGAQTAAGCEPCANVGGWFESAARAAFDGSTLVLLDADAKVTGRAVHAPSIPTSAPASVPASASTPAVGPLASPTFTSPAASCTGFALDLASNRGGQASPTAAAEWFAAHGHVAGVPLHGWHEVGRGNAEASVRSGNFVLHAFQGSDQTWQIDSGQDCP
jgi:hypothetical protein